MCVIRFLKFIMTVFDMKLDTTKKISVAIR